MSRENGSIITGEETLEDEDFEEAKRRAAKVKGIDVKAIHKEGWAPGAGRGGTYEEAAKKRDEFKGEQRAGEVRDNPLGLVKPKAFEDTEHVAGRETPQEKYDRRELERERVEELRKSIKGS